MTISTNAEKSLTKFNAFHDKNTMNRKELYQHNKDHVRMTSLQLISYSMVRLKAFPPRAGTRQDACF